MILIEFEQRNLCVYVHVLELSTFEYGCLVGLHIKEGKKQRCGWGGDTDEQFFSDKPPLIQCGETYSTQ